MDFKVRAIHENKQNLYRHRGSGESGDHFKPGSEALVFLQLYCFFMVKRDLDFYNPLDKFV